MIPFEFIVDGPPVSHQAADRARLAAWRDRVRAAATGRWPNGQPALRGNIELVVTYYHERETINLDNDNLVKPIQDALAGLVYENDKQITDIKVRKTGLDGSFRVRGVSMVLAEAFHRNREFLHIKVGGQPDHSEFLS